MREPEDIAKSVESSGRVEEIEFVKKGTREENGVEEVEMRMRQGQLRCI